MELILTALLLGYAALVCNNHFKKLKKQRVKALARVRRIKK